MTPQINDLTSPVFDINVLRSAVINPDGKRVIINGTPDDLSAKNSASDKGSGVKAALIIIAFIAAIIAMAVFSQTEPMLCLAVFGALVLFVGVINLFQNGISLEAAPALIPVIVGLLCTGIPAMNVYHRSHPDSFYFTQSMVIDIILVCFIVVGAALIVIPPVVRSRSLKKCPLTVNAVCIYRNTRDAVSHSGNRTRHYNLYAPAWQYEVNGVIYVTRENAFTAEDVPNIGDMRQIRFNPDAPSEIYRPLNVKTASPLIIGICFAGIAAAVLFVLHR